MSSRGPYRRQTPQFRLQLRHEIRTGAIKRRDAAQHHNLSTNLLQLWLTQYEKGGELTNEEADASVVAEYEAKIAVLARKVGQLTMELDPIKKSAAPAPCERQRDLIDHHRPQACSNIRIATGFCYLAAILDACSHKVVGCAISRTIDTPLALAALRSAVQSRHPPAGCIFHTDHGCQYASEIYRRALADAGSRAR